MRSANFRKKPLLVTIYGMLTASLFLLSACSAIKNPIAHQYQLNAYSTEKLSYTPSSATLLITPTEATTGYQTEQMQYSKQTYALNSFAKNSWFSPPASMLYSLLIQSIQHSSYFYAVSSGAYISKTTYRLDTQLLNIRQNFLKKPSQFELKVKAVLTRIEDNQIIASKAFTQSIPCPQETPYGGVIAANIATVKLTKDITHFLVKQVERISSQKH